MVKQITAANFESEVLKSEKPVLVDFYADWCGPCKMTAPVLEQLSGEVSAVSFGKINIDDSPELAQKYQVMAVPTLMVFQGGEPLNRAVGGQNLSGLKNLIAKFL